MRSSASQPRGEHPLQVVSINPMVVVIVLFALQGALGLALCLLFGRYHRAYHRPHLRLWSISFGMLAVYMLLAGVALHASQSNPDAFAMRTAISLVSQVAAYQHVAFLVLGTLSLGARHEPPAWLRNGVVAAATVLGVTAALAYSWDPGATQERIFARVGLRYLVGSAVYVGIALALMSGTWRDKPLGQRIVALSFLAFGVVLMANFVLLTVPGVGRSLSDFTPWFSLFDLVAEFSIGMGLVIWLHEDERGRADRASRQVEQLTYYDGLTGLPNRNLFAARLAGHLPEAAVARQRYVVAAARAAAVTFWRVASSASTKGRKSSARSWGNVSARLARSPLGSMMIEGMLSIAASSSRVRHRPVLPLPVMPTQTACVVRSLASYSTGSWPTLRVAASKVRPR